MDFDIKKLTETKVNLQQKKNNLTAQNVMAQPVEDGLSDEERLAAVQEALGVKLPTQEEKDLASKLVAGAAFLMHDRLTGKTEYPIAQWQFDRWSESIQQLSKAFVYGQIQYDDLLEFVEGTINMGYVEEEPEKPVFNNEEQGE